MKDYIKKKLSSLQKGAIVGQGAEKRRYERYARMATREFQELANIFGGRLSPPRARRELLSYQLLESLDLISEGPIQGFFDQKTKESCGALEGTYLDDVVVAERGRTHRVQENLHHKHLKGLFTDFTEPVAVELQKYKTTVNKYFPIKERVNRAYNMKASSNDPDSTHYDQRHGTGNRGDALQYHYSANTIALPQSTTSIVDDYKYVLKMSCNYLFARGAQGNGRGYGVTQNHPTEPDNLLIRDLHDVGFGEDASGNPNPSHYFSPCANMGFGKPLGKIDSSNYRDSGAGYRTAPFMARNFYSQDHVVSGLSNDPDGRGRWYMPIYNKYSPDRPKRFQGSQVWMCGISQRNGSIDSSVCIRNFNLHLGGPNGYGGRMPNPQDSVFYYNSFYYSPHYASVIRHYCTVPAFRPERWNDLSYYSERMTKSDGSPLGTSDSNTAYITTGDMPFEADRYEFFPGATDPGGLKEPIIKAVDSLLSGLPNIRKIWSIDLMASSYFGATGFDNSPSLIKGTFFDTVTTGGETKNNVLCFSGTKTTHDSSLSTHIDIETPDTSDRHTNILEFKYAGCGPFSGVDFDNSVYRITGSYLIPTGHVLSGFRFFWQGIGGFPTVNSADAMRANPNTWLTFDQTFTNNKGGFKRTGELELRFYNNGSHNDDTTDYSDTNPPGLDNIRNYWTTGDKLFMHGWKIFRTGGQNVRADNTTNNYMEFGEYTIPTPTTGYLVFGATGNFGPELNIDDGTGIENSYNLNFAMLSDFGAGANRYLDAKSEVFDPQNPLCLKYAVDRLTGYSGLTKRIQESVTRFRLSTPSVGFYDLSYYYPYITGSAIAYDHVINLVPKKRKRFAGAFMWPVYLGRNSEATSGLSEGDYSRVFIEPGETVGATLKLRSGIASGYDVFSGNSNGDMVYLHAANPNLQSLPTSVSGKAIGLRLDQRFASGFNFTNFGINTTLGEEAQSPLVSGSHTEIRIGKELIGPYENPDRRFEELARNTTAARGEAGSHLEINDEGFYVRGAEGGFTGLSYPNVPATSTNAYRWRNVTGYGFDSNAIPALSSVDIINRHPMEGFNLNTVENDGLNGTIPSILTGRLSDFTNWNLDPFRNNDERSITHVISRSDIDAISVHLQIQGLRSERHFNDDAGRRVALDRLAVNIGIEMGFEGLSEKNNPDGSTPIHAPQAFRVVYEGVVSRAYNTRTRELPLPKYSDILSSFPNETIKSLQAKYPRYVTVRKLDYETYSPRLVRAVAVDSIVEICNASFSYPHSAIAKINLDARQFSEIPTRNYNLRLKKVLVPSNYFPLDGDGKDKRFLNPGESTNGINIYRGDWDGRFKLAWTDNPAWILYDLMINNRYGLGSRIDDKEDINIFNLYKIGRYCDAVDNNGNFVGIPDGIGGFEPRFSCNILIDEPDNALTRLEEIASVFNGRAFWSNGMIDFYADRPVAPSAHFNNSNVFDGVFNYESVSKSANFNCVEVQFMDKDDEFAVKTETLEDEEGIRNDGKLLRKVNGRGTTSRGQARRLAKYVLYSNKLEREIVSFKAGSESLMLNVGDVIKVNDEVKNFKIDYSQILEVNYNDYQIAIENNINQTGVADASPGGGPFIDITGGADIYVPTGQTGVESLYEHARKDGLIDLGRLNDFDQLQAINYPIKSIQASGENALKLSLETPGPKFRYFRITGGARDDTNLAEDMALADIELIERDGTSYPTTHLTSASAAGGVTVSHGYQHSATYASFRAFDSNTVSSFWWTLSNSNAGLNWIQADLGSAKDISGLNIKIYHSQQKCPKFRILGSDVATFETFETFGEVDFGTSVISEVQTAANNVGNTTITVALNNKVDIASNGSQTTSNQNFIEYNKGQELFRFIPTGSYANLKSAETSDGSNTYRVMSIVPEEDNLYGITATEYNSGKFNIIESDDESYEIDVRTEKPYNIGVPKSLTKEITEPNSFTVSSQENDIGMYDLTVTVKGELEGNESKYLVTVVYPNGARMEKRVEKGSTISSGLIETPVVFKSVSIYGDYNVFVSSIE